MKTLKDSDPRYQRRDPARHRRLYSYAVNQDNRLSLRKLKFPPTRSYSIDGPLGGR